MNPDEGIITQLGQFVRVHVCPLLLDCHLPIGQFVVTDGGGAWNEMDRQGLMAGGRILIINTFA